MTEITLDFRSVTSRPLERLREVAGRMDKGARLRIVVDRLDTQIAKEMYSLLEENGFRVSSKGAHGDDGFNIFARKEE